MSNHAYVIPKKVMPSVEKVNEDAQEIVRRKFPMFQLDYDDKGNNWFLKHPSDDWRLSLTFWLGEYGDPATFDAEKETWGRMLPCIEFRHGHGYPIFWWIEYEIREELARLYDAWSVDDATGEFDPPQLERYNTYREYMIATRPEILEHSGVADFMEQEIIWMLEQIPEDVKPLIGENFS